MISLLRWGLGSGHEHHLSDKKGVKEEEHFQNPQGTAAAMSDTTKRKRGKSTNSVHRPTKRSPNITEVPDVPALEPPAAASNGQDSSISDHTVDTETMDWNQVAGTPDAAETEDEVATERLAQLKAVISRQFNLEILLKHNELRLIDQEIAKVQVALEQLRRCSVIPYPSMTSDPNDMANVTAGKGAFAPSIPGMLPATQPPPWGVTDGPYTRHYAKWLLPDPVFDGAHPDAVHAGAKASKTVPDRHTRGGKDISLSMTKSRPRAGFSRYQAVGAATGEHKDTKGPMILKRALDGKLVKLVCLHCHREDFNSAQGFINHCRIAHSHNLASHEAAARECGQEIDPSEVVVTAPEASTPVVLQPVTTIGFVHPMNRLQMQPIPKLSIPQRKARAANPHNGQEPRPRPQNTIPASFNPSTQVPHLSRLFAKLGKSIDLTAAVADATTKDSTMYLSDTEQAHSDLNSDEETTPTKGLSRMPSRISRPGGPSLPHNISRPKSHKGPERIVRRPYTSQTKATSISLPAVKDQTDLSPHTVSSVNAPSLISDSENGSSSTSPSDEEEDGAYASDTNEDSSAAETSNNGEEEAEEKDLNETALDVDMTNLPLRTTFAPTRPTTTHRRPGAVRGITTRPKEATRQNATRTHRRSHAGNAAGRADHRRRQQQRRRRADNAPLSY